jgi:hypothetical protein
VERKVRPSKIAAVGCGLLTACQMQHLAQVMEDGLEANCRDPALGLLSDGMPGRKIVCNYPSWCICTNHPTPAFKDFMQRAMTLE